MSGNQSGKKSQIKEIAERLSLSPGTVSVVLNGRGDSVRISKATQKRVRDMAKEMGYQPNIYARRLRKAAEEEAALVIAVFWRQDNLNSRLARFLSGLHMAIQKKGCNAEMVIQPYEPGRLTDFLGYLNSNRFSGAMIGGISEEEQAALEEHKFDIPIILIGRDSRKLNCVLLDNYQAGQECAAMVGTSKTESASIIGFHGEGRAGQLMEYGFIHGCREKGIDVNSAWNIRVGRSSYEIGRQAALELIDRVPFPAAWLVMDCRLAVGIMAACAEKNINVPQDLKLVFFEESEILKFNKPALSSVDIPVMNMAEEALDILILSSENRMDIPIKRELVPVYYPRESSGAAE